MLDNHQTLDNIDVKMNNRTNALSRGETLGFILIYIFMFGLAEFFQSFVSQSWGIFTYVIILLSLVFVGSLNAVSGNRSVWVSLGLVPLIRIISISMPVLLEISLNIWYIIISIPILSAIILTARSLKFNFTDIGLTFDKPFIQVLTAFSGIILSSGAYFILKPLPWNLYLSLTTTLFPALVLLLFTGFVEELAFRGVIQRAISQIPEERGQGNAAALKPRNPFIYFIEKGDWGWILVAAIYAVIQLFHGSLFFSLYVFGVGLYFGWIVKKTGSIIGVSIAHGLINVGMFLVLPHIIK